MRVCIFRNTFLLPDNGSSTGTKKRNYLYRRVELLCLHQSKKGAGGLQTSRICSFQMVQTAVFEPLAVRQLAMIVFPYMTRALHTGIIFCKKVYTLYDL